NVIAALADLRVIDTAFDFYLERYVAPGLQVGLVPPPSEVFGGFSGLLHEPARQAELDDVPTDPRPEKPGPYHSHPPMSERIAALKALPQNGSVPDSSEVPALTLVANPDDVLARVAMRTLQKQVAGKQAVPWDVLAQTVGMQRAEQRAKPLQDIVFR